MTSRVAGNWTCRTFAIRICSWSLVSHQTSVLCPFKIAKVVPYGFCGLVRHWLPQDTDPRVQIPWRLQQRGKRLWRMNRFDVWSFYGCLLVANCVVEGLSKFPTATVTTIQIEKRSDLKNVKDVKWKLGFYHWTAISATLISPLLEQQIFLDDGRIFKLSPSVWVMCCWCRSEWRRCFIGRSNTFFQHWNGNLTHLIICVSYQEFRSTHLISGCCGTPLLCSSSGSYLLSLVGK